MSSKYDRLPIEVGDFIGYSENKHHTWYKVIEINSDDSAFGRIKYEKHTINQDTLIMSPYYPYPTISGGAEIIRRGKVLKTTKVLLQGEMFDE